MQNVGIVGLGLIGGSLAKTIKLQHTLHGLWHGQERGHDAPRVPDGGD